MELNFTNNELEIIKLLSEFRNYNDLQTEINDNAVGVYIKDILQYTSIKDTKIIRGVVSSLIKKDMLYTDDVNGELFFRATDECLKFLYEVLDME